MEPVPFIFFGTPEFAAIILERLIGAGFVPAAVVTNPDQLLGRRKIVTALPVKQGIQNQVESVREQVQILQPATSADLLNTKNLLLDTHPTFAVVAAYAKILPKEIFSLPRLGTLGVHPSLLPRRRGASPIQTAILEGDRKVGTTLFLLDERVDHGPILAARELEGYEPDTMSYETLLHALAELSADLLIETIPKLLSGAVTQEPQNESEATMTKKFTTEDAFADFAKDEPLTVYRKVLALNPEPGVWTTRDGKRMKILAAEFRGGKLVLTTVQFEGKRPQAANIPVVKS